MNTLLIASDHAGYELKEYIKTTLGNEGYHFKDYGTFSADSMDYPDVVHPLATFLQEHPEHPQQQFGHMQASRDVPEQNEVRPSLPLCFLIR